MPRLGDGVHFVTAGDAGGGGSAAESTIAGIFLLEEGGRCLIAVAQGTPHFCLVIHQKQNFSVTWVKAAAVQMGPGSSRLPIIQLPAKEILKVMLDVESDQ